MPNAILSALQIIHALTIMKSLGHGCWCSPHFTDRKTEAQRGLENVTHLQTAELIPIKSFTQHPMHSVSAK